MLLSRSALEVSESLGYKPVLNTQHNQPSISAGCFAVLLCLPLPLIDLLPVSDLSSVMGRDAGGARSALAPCICLLCTELRLAE